MLRHCRKLDMIIGEETPVVHVGPGVKRRRLALDDVTIRATAVHQETDTEAEGHMATRGTQRDKDATNGRAAKDRGSTGGTPGKNEEGVHRASVGFTAATSGTCSSPYQKHTSPMYTASYSFYGRLLVDGGPGLPGPPAGRGFTSRRTTALVREWQ